MGEVFFDISMSRGGPVTGIENPRPHRPPTEEAR
jgi:hypothetical protein